MKTVSYTNKMFPAYQKCVFYQKRKEDVFSFKDLLLQKSMSMSPNKMCPLYDTLVPLLSCRFDHFEGVLIFAYLLTIIFLFSFSFTK